MPLCPKCGKEFQTEVTFCPSCGHNLKQAPPAKPTLPLEQKNTGVAAVLASVFGFFGLMGIGHIYVGRIGRGIILLIAGIILHALTWGSFIIGLVSLGLIGAIIPLKYPFELGFIGAIIFAIILFVLWIWQTYDAYNLAKIFNRIIQETGKAPW
jgi:hypothetical protein